MRAIGLIILFVFAFNQHAQACKCAELQPLNTESVKAYELIFSGRVMAVSACTEEGRGTVRFVIDSLYKGKAFAECDVQFDCATSCAMSFAPGERWTVYATYLKYGSPEVILCSHSRKLSPAGSVDYTAETRGTSYQQDAQWLSKSLGIQTLNEEKKEVMKSRELVHPEGANTVWLLVGGLAGVVVLFFVLKRFLK